MVGAAIWFVVVSSANFEAGDVGRVKKTKGSLSRSSLFIFQQTVNLFHRFFTVHDANLVVDGFIVDGFEHHGYEFFTQAFLRAMFNCLAQDFIPAAGL